MLTPWIEVNLQFKFRTTPEMDALNQRFIAVVNAAKKAFKEAEPLLAKWELTDTESTAQALALQDQYPWMREHLGSPDIEKWFVQANVRIHETVSRELRESFYALVQHRYAYVKMSGFINTFQDVTQVQNDIAALRKKEHPMQFCNHDACAVGVLIDVRSTFSDGTSHMSARRTMLIGDVTPTGLDDGCCAAGLKDDDVIIRYRDLRPIILEAHRG